MVRSITEAEARRFVAEVQDAFASHDVERMLAGFTEDVVVRFAEQPEMRGKEAVRAFLRARMQRQSGYTLEKSLRAVSGDVIGNVWTGSWTDSVTGKPMEGRGTEFWTMRDGRIAVWEATFNAWEKEGPRVSPIL